MASSAWARGRRRPSGRRFGNLSPVASPRNSGRHKRSQDPPMASGAPPRGFQGYGGVGLGGFMLVWGEVMDRRRRAVSQPSQKRSREDQFLEHFRKAQEEYRSAIEA